MNKCGSIEYKMPAAMAKQILKTRKKSEEGMNPQEFLVKYVNATGRLKGNCVRVLTDL